MTTRNTVPGCGDGSRGSRTRFNAIGEKTMEYLIGVGLAMAVCVFAMLAGFDRDRVFYPTVVAVNATYYILFAVMGSSPSVLVVESLMAAVFFAVAVAG